jgi:hypothetical protein
MQADGGAALSYHRERQQGAMAMRTSIFLSSLAVGMLVASPLAAMASKPAKSAAARKPVVDLADAVVGTYDGDVISDSRGSSRSGVTITVTKAGPGTVVVSSSYKRLPTFTVRLTRAMQTIQQANGDNVFLIDQAKSPWSLDVTVDGASWSGTKRG